MNFAVILIIVTVIVVICRSFYNDSSFPETVKKLVLEFVSTGHDLISYFFVGSIVSVRGFRQQ